MISRSTLKFFPALLLFIFGLANVKDAVARHPPSPSTLKPESPDTLTTEPGLYKSGKSPGGHLLAFPSYLFRWTTTPIDAGFKIAEKTLPELFRGERGDYGVYPLLELGGATGYSYGLLFFHKRPFYPNHSARIEALFGSSEYNDFDLDYDINRFLSHKGRLVMDATYANRPDRTFLFGNDAAFDDRSFYDREDMEAAFSYRYALTDKFRLNFTTRYLKRQITESNSETAVNASAFPETLISNYSLLSNGVIIAIDNARGVRRINRGSRLITNLRWSRSLTNTRFNYINYSAEWNRFIPIPPLPDDRRFALKGELHKAVSLSGKEIPFFENPSLGSSRDLRGFSTDRFRDTGSLLFTLEYRYPIWDFSDAVLFVDEGQVFNRYSDIGIRDFYTSYGFGFHLLSAQGFAFRSEFAFSRETSRFILLISPNF